MLIVTMINPRAGIHVIPPRNCDICYLSPCLMRRRPGCRQGNQLLRAPAAGWSEFLPLYHSSQGQSRPSLGLQGWRFLEELPSYEQARENEGACVSSQAAMAPACVGNCRFTVPASGWHLEDNLVGTHGKGVRMDGSMEGEDGRTGVGMNTQRGEASRRSIST